uniref:Uncharacterized protein n=1 Tax=Otarine gammaherpesvirus 4 TaxID=2801541 RepID=A0A889IVV1_9GAMA|nr:hypothetical protein [Otarine gammaherpesvirus 4]
MCNVVLLYYCIVLHCISMVLIHFLSYQVKPLLYYMWELCVFFSRLGGLVVPTVWVILSVLKLSPLHSMFHGNVTFPLPVLLMFPLFYCLQESNKKVANKNAFTHL